MISFQFFFTFLFCFDFSVYLSFHFCFHFIIVFNENGENTLCCVGVRHHSSTLSNEAERTETCQEFLFGKCVQYNRRQSRTVSGNTVAARVLGKFHKSWGRISARAGRKPAKIAMQNPGSAVEFGRKTGSAPECEDLKATLPTIRHGIRFHHKYDGDFFQESWLEYEYVYNFTDIQMSATNLYPSAPLEPVTTIEFILEEKKVTSRVSKTF